MEISATPTRIFTVCAIRSRPTLKRRIFRSLVHKELFKAIRENVMNTEGGFRRERLLQRAGKIPTPMAFNGIAELDFVNYGDFPTFFRIPDTFSRYAAVTFIGH